MHTSPKALALLVAVSGVLLSSSAHGGTVEISSEEATRLEGYCDGEIGWGALGKIAYIFSHADMPETPPECKELSRQCVEDEYRSGSRLHRLCRHFDLADGAHSMNASVRLRLGHSSAASSPGADAQVVTLGGAARVLLGAPGLAVGVSAEMGAGLSGGFAWDLGLDLGAGTTLGNSAALGFTLGFGGGGHTGRLASSVRFPAELWVSANLGRWLQLNAWARENLLTTADSRKNGAPHALLGDELILGASLGLGRSRWKTGSLQTAGYRIGVAYAERLDTEELAIFFAYGLSSHSGY